MTEFGDAYCPPVDLTAFDSAQLSRFSERYGVDRFVPLPDFLAPDQAATLLAATQDVPTRRVQCGNEFITWDEQDFDSGHTVYRFFEQPEVVSLVRALTGQNEVSDLTCWTSCYKTGEYIEPHCDRAGFIQLLVCLQAPRSERNGGKLIVNGSEMFLTPGVAIAFEATSLEHYTTPLVPSPDEPDPRRVVLVGRYFFD